jgi:agmatinase
VSGQFAALPPDSSRLEASRAVLLPAPYDATTTYRPGTRDGPRAIVDASRELELYDLELECEIAEAVGLHTAPEIEPHLGDPAAMVARVRAAVRAVLDGGRLPILLGGEHTLTAGAVAAAAGVWPDLALLYLDAHADVRGPYLGARYNHASALRLALEDGGLDAAAAVAVGVRSMAAEEALYLRRGGLPVVTAARVAGTRRGAGADDSLARLWDETLAALGPAGRPLYISVDLDVFDPGALPAVGTPEPGGLDWYEVTSLLRAAARRFRVVAADVMELAPAEGPVASAFTAAKLVYKLAGYALLSGAPASGTGGGGPRPRDAGGATTGYAATAKESAPPSA